MVLTNFECWANVGSAGNVAADIEHHALNGGSSIGAGVAASRHVDLFNPRAVQQNLGPVSQVAPTAGVSHMSSNGYYGFAFLNAVHELNNSNNNNDNNFVNQNISNNNASTRCKKRYFVPNDDDLLANLLFDRNQHAAAAIDNNLVRGQGAAATAAKRCRYDDDFAAQYFNDFFTMQAAAPPATQIGTQSCLMDTEEQQAIAHTQQLPEQQQVDVAMRATSLHTEFDSNPSNVLHARSLQQVPQQQPQVQQQQQLQQVHFQGHLHRANRDVSRCMLSHMI